MNLIKSFLLWLNPPPNKMGEAAGVKVSINSHGDPMQPWEGDSVAIASFINTEQGRRRIWSQVASASVGVVGPVTAASAEFDMNNDAGEEPDEPGGLRSLYGLWLSGSSASPHLGSSAILITTADGSVWRNGLFIDRADVGIRLGGTFQNALGIDMGQTKMRFRVFTVPPDNPPPGYADLYIQNGPEGRIQFVAHFPSGARVLLQE